MNIYVLCSLVMSTVFCFSEENTENLDALKNGIELGQKVLDEKVERYNELLKKYHKEKQRIKDKKNSEVVVGDQRTGDGSSADDKKMDLLADNQGKNGSALVKKEGDSSVKKGGEKLPEKTAAELELRRLSTEIEEEQATIDKKVESYNKALQKKTAQEEEDKEHADLVEPLKAQLQHLTNMVEHLQKEMKEFKQTARGGISPEKKIAQNAFEQALIALKNNEREGISKLVKFLEDYPEEELAIEANLQLGNTYNKIGLWDKAFVTFESVMENRKTIIPQIIEAKLGMAETHIGKNDRESACMTLIKLETSNNPMSEAQLDRYQRLLVDYHCSSKMDRDERKKEKTNKNVFID